MDGNEFTDYETRANQEIGETNLVIIHSDEDHDDVRTGTNIVPEYPYSVSVLRDALCGVIVFARMLVKQGKFA
jgi:hypothetical protein